MAEQTILVTGSTDGIGKATARVLSRQGHRVLLHGRDPEKGRRVLAELEAATGSDRLALFVADLSVQERVRDLAEEIGGRTTGSTSSSTTPGSSCRSGRFYPAGSR
jgi:NAD(P)-dependent dehydrogenase (short-subunit alcohol dehydrogenase family)